MKRIFALLTAVAMVISFLPSVEAAETAQLTIMTSFVDLDIIRVDEISAELDDIAKDAEAIYADALNSGDIQVIKEAIERLERLMGHIEIVLLAELNDILLRRPDLEVLINGVIAKAGKIQVAISGYIKELKALLPQLSIWSDPAGPYEVRETETLEFKVIAEDLDAVNVNLEAVLLPQGAKWIVDEGQPISAPRREGTFIWTPAAGIAPGDENAHAAIFEAVNDIGEAVQLEVAITVLPAPMISIELNDANWQIAGLAFGDAVENMSPLNVFSPEALHRVTSRSNINIGVDIGYGNCQGYDPGGNGPGDGIFAVMLCEDGYIDGVYLPASDSAANTYPMIPLITNLEPDASKQVPLRLYAPTKGDPDVGLSVVLEIRAYATE